MGPDARLSPLSGRPALCRRTVPALWWAALLLLAWDGSGADLALTRLFGNAQGFAWRDSAWASQWLHDGGRAMAWLLMASLVLAAWRAQPHEPAATPGHVMIGPDNSSAAQPSRHERWQWLAVMLLCMLLVPALKRFSATSCPWDLKEFGGVAQYVSHWRLFVGMGVGDGGSGRCFPSGHAVAAFGFFGQYFLWRAHNPQRARRWLYAVLAVGALFSAAQLVRGAHYLSHSLWSAWLCWALCSVAAWSQRTMPGLLIRH